MKRGLFRKNARKAQAAMEFLMTYGWALLVVLVAIGALAFFGVLNPGQFLPDQCTLFAGVTCTSYYASTDASGVVLTIQNGLGYSMSSVSLNIKVDGIDMGAGSGNDCTGQTESINDGGSLTCNFDTAGYAQGDRIKGILELVWEDAASSPNSRTRNGNLALTVEA